MKFRLDINGLRAIAVLMVAIYHFKYQFGYGGYAGVDVFFVISGFLMAEIWRKSTPNPSSAVDFYRRRLNRIYPALLVFSGLTFALLVPMLGPNALRNSARELASVLSFSSNFFYWRSTGGYFGAAADSFALLHTWSLSLEWQFYLIFPLVVYLTHRSSKKVSAFVVYSTLALASFGLCLTLMPTHPDASFYLLPTRAWELLLGACTSAIPLRNRAPRVTELAALLSLGLFFVLAKDASSWPGISTLIPTLATAALLHANIGNDRSLLRFAPFQVIGSASYSIYLAHWPIAHFFYLKQIPFNSLNSAMGLISSVAIGVGSYYFVENKFRPKFVGMAATAGAILAASLFVVWIAPSKYWMSANRLRLDFYENYSGTDRHAKQFGNHQRVCFITRAHGKADVFDPACLAPAASSRVLLLGDSHAAQLSEAIGAEFRDATVAQVTASGCRPVPDTSGAAGCVALMETFYRKVLPSAKFDIALIAANWQAVSEDPYILSKHITVAADLLSRRGVDVYVIGQSKVFDHSVLGLLSVGADIQSHQIVRAAEFNEILGRELVGAGIKYIDVYDFHCPNGFCRYVDESGEPIMFDQSHLTPPWASRQAAFIMTEIMD